MPANRHRFAARMIKAVRAAGVTGEIDYDPDTFRLPLGEGWQLLILTNAFADYCGAPLLQRRGVTFFQE